MKILNPLLCFLVAAGCSKYEASSGSPEAPGAALNGTVTGGGGGNGLEGRPIETFAVNIESLSEYKLYVAPLLRRMVNEDSDALVSYLTWAVRGKSWYFVPTELSKLPAERTALTFPSDQLALQSEKEIYISSLHYAKKSRKERAYLLLHEMVMAARFLARLSPQKQCEILSPENMRACLDGEMLKLAQAAPTGLNSGTLNADDHEAVRALTVFIMEPDQDLSAERVRTARRRLQFPLPWDQVISDLTVEATSEALKRSSLSGDLFHALGKKSRGNHQVECTYRTYAFSEAQVLMEMIQVLPENAEEPDSRSSWVGWGGSSGNRNIVSTSQISLFASFEARGAFLPGAENKIVDLVTLTPNFAKLPSGGASRFDMAEGSDAQILELYVSRESAPRVLELRVVPKRVMKRSNARPEEPAYELVPALNIPTLRCINQSTPTR